MPTISAVFATNAKHVIFPSSSSSGVGGRQSLLDAYSMGGSGARFPTRAQSHAKVNLRQSPGRATFERPSPIKFRKATLDECLERCLQGTVTSDYDHLVDCFGEPEFDTSDKTPAEWCLAFEDGIAALAERIAGKLKNEGQKLLK